MVRVRKGAKSDDSRLRIFISYSRRDCATADALVDALTARGFEVTIDRRDLPFGEKWQAELAEFIRLSDTVIWLVSEASVDSEWVNWELDEVARRAKRLVPVMIGETPRDALPRQLGEIHILPAEGLFNLDRDLGTLVGVLETDRAWLKEGSRLADRAREWIGKGRPTAQLLRGAALSASEQWKERRPAKAPAPAEEVLELVLASRQAATRRQHWWLGGSVALTIAALALAGFAYSQRDEARQQRSVADEQRRVAEKNAMAARVAEARETQQRRQAQITQSGLLSKAAAARANSREAAYATSMLMSLHGLPDGALGVDGAALDGRPYLPAAEYSLFDAQFRNHERYILAGHQGPVVEAIFSPQRVRIATRSEDGTVRLWDATSGFPLASLVGNCPSYRENGWPGCEVNSVAFSPDGSRLVTASSDNTARIWDASTGQLLSTLTGHKGWVRRAEFSPDGTRIVTASNDKTARIWNAATGQVLATLDRHEGDVYGGFFSPDGTRLVTISDDSTRVRLWDTTGRWLANLEGYPNAINQAAFSPNGTRLVIWGLSNSVQLWDVAAIRLVTNVDGHTDAVFSAGFSPDGARLVTASYDGTARVWDASTGRPHVTLAGHDGPVVSAAFGPDNTRLVTASANGTARVWNASTGEQLATLAGHEAVIRSVGFSPDGASIITASDDKTARLWDVAARSPLATFTGPSQRVNGPDRSVAFSPDGARIVTPIHDNTAGLWDVATNQPLAVLVGHNGPVHTAVFSLDGTKLVTAASENTARLWDGLTGRPVATLTGHEQKVVSAAFSPDGMRIVTASLDNTARLWDSSSGRLLTIFVGHNGPLSFAAISPDGTRLVTASVDNSARLWDTETGREVATLAGHSRSVSSATFSPDGMRIVTSSTDNTARLWESATGRPLATLTGHSNSVFSAVFNPSGTRIVTASADSTARLWDTVTGQLVTTFKGHIGPIRSAMFSPDGLRLVTASDDSTFRVWDVSSGRPLAAVEGFSRELTGGLLANIQWGSYSSPSSVNWAVFSPDGAGLVTTSMDRTVQLWRIFPTTQSLVDHAKRTVPRCLTQAQLAELYLPREPLRWCITGPGLEAEPDPAKWQPKWPYHTLAWRDWLAARDRGETPDLPTE